MRVPHHPGPVEEGEEVRAERLRRAIRCSALRGFRLENERNLQIEARRGRGRGHGRVPEPAAERPRHRIPPQERHAEAGDSQPTPEGSTERGSEGRGRDVSSVE